VIAVDTNIVVRLLVEDDSRQTRLSKALFEENLVFLSETVILETAWVLHKLYGFTNVEVVNGLRGLFGLTNVNLRNPDFVESALQWHEGGLDFADALHLALAIDATSFATFDRTFVRRAASLSGKMVTLLQ